MTTSFGFTQERANELAAGLDAMMKDLAPGNKLTLVYASDMFNYIRKFCNTEEEYTWCIMNHITWLARTGRLVPPR